MAKNKKTKAVKKKGIKEVWMATITDQVPRKIVLKKEMWEAGLFGEPTPVWVWNKSEMLENSGAYRGYKSFASKNKRDVEIWIEGVSTALSYVPDMFREMTTRNKGDK